MPARQGSAVRITATKLVTFSQCPFLYRVLYEVREPLPVLGTRRRFGNAVHAAIAAYEKTGRSLARAIETLGERGRGLSSADLEEAKSILEWRHGRAKEKEGRPVLVEGSLQASLAGHRLQVRMDRLDAVGADLLLAEYKAGRVVDLEVVRTQLMILAYAIHDVFKRTPSRWEVEVLSARKVIPVPAVTDPQDLRSFAVTLAKRLSSGDRQPKPYDPRFCRRCPAREYCPLQRREPRPFKHVEATPGEPTLL